METSYKLAGAAGIAQVSRHLRRHAHADYSPDPLGRAVPAGRATAGELSLDNLFKAWKAELKSKTEKRYLGVLTALAAFLGTRNALTITVDDMFRWKQHRIDLGLYPGTIKRIDLAVPRSICGWAKGGTVDAVQPRC